MPGRSCNPLLRRLVSYGGMALLVCCTTPEPTAWGGFGAGSSYLPAPAPAPATATSPADATPVPAAASGAAGDAALANTALANTALANPALANPALANPALRDPAPGDDPKPAVAPLPDEAPAADDELRQLERDLRQELSTAADPADCALELAGLLADLERHREALAVLTTARQRSANPALRVAIAGLQRDLGQRHLAVAELVAVRTEQGAVAMSPALQMELAELQWLEGSREAALATISDLRRAHAEAPWLAKHAAAVDALELEVGMQKAPNRVRIRDLLGNLRGAPGVLVRLRTLEELVKLADGLPADRRDGGMSLRDRAVAIGLADDAGVVRARAIQLAAPKVAAPEILFRTALRDADAIVRTVTAESSVERLRDGALPLLVEAIAIEQDPKVFRALHEAARSIVVGAPTLAPDEELVAERRAALAKAWSHR